MVRVVQRIVVRAELSGMSARVFGYAVLYLLAVVVGRLTVLDDAGDPVIWPAAGMAAAWLVMRRDSPWRWADIVLLAVLTVAGLTVTGVAVPAALVHAGAAVAAGLTFTALTARLAPDLWAGAGGGRPLSTLADLWGILLAAVLAATAMSCIDAIGDQIFQGEASLTTFATRVVRDTASVLTFGVAVRHAADVRRGSWASPSRAAGLECAAIFVVSAGAYYYTFVINHGLPIGFALLPLTVWAAVRMPMTLAIGHSLLFSCVAAGCTLTGAGPYAEIADPRTRVLVIELYLVVLAVAGLALALSRNERNALIDRLRDSEQEALDKAGMMTTVVNSMTEGLAILDPAGRLVLRNPAAGRLLGSVNTVAGGVALGSDYGFFHPDGRPLADADLPYARALAGEEVEPMDVLVRNAAVPEGRIVRFNVARIAVRADGPQHVVVVFHDVTADRRHRDELMSFAGVVAHDLLNPLTTIEGWSEVLEHELAGYQPAERVARIQRAAARMRTFLNGLLAYTAARDGKLMPTTVNLALLVGDIVNSRYEQAENTGTPPPYFEVGRLEAVEADPVLTRQLLENLVDFALGPTPPGVTPYVSISCQPARNGMLRVDILDNGIGLPETVRKEIFTNFHSGRADGGHGLELAICKRIVERHGGTIEALPNPYGSGSRMSFTLPAGRSLYALSLDSHRSDGRMPAR
ncbi:ATP-binding protein [Actinoplanes sp. DH11]|uniref:ATP-binding protein n=1 Tax=Actinoplanes sp. DH11 TaxID=2857011 RepID=UPI001E35BCDF|nr:ATP-binding protein [Actinoplanes sp. DH11]